MRAVWKRTGAYYLQYDPYDSRYNVGRDVMVDDEMMHNSVLYDPSAPGDISSPGAAYYHDHAQAVVLQHPTYIPAHYIFRGWELLTDDGEKTGEYYAPGDAFTVDSAYADRQGYIHFEAAYEPETESVRIVETAALTLDANTSHSGYAVSNGLSIYPDSIYADLDHNQVIFADQPNNFKVRLSEYYNNFLNSEGYQLIGWSKTPDDLVPDFAPDAVIGVDTTDNENDILYAVWEPMYYLTLENHSTDYNITFDLQFTGNSGAVYAVESGSATGSYIREPFGTGYTSDSIGGQPKFYYSKFDPADLTHDNRYEFYRGIDNLRLENGDLNPNAKYIFKVYAYMKLSDDDDSIYQSEGVTVQLYDLAIRTSIAG